MFGEDRDVSSHENAIFVWSSKNVSAQKCTVNSFCVFCGWEGKKEFCPISPTFSTIGLVRKKGKDHGMILLKQKKVRDVNVRSTWFTILTFHKSHLFKKKRFCSKFSSGWVFFHFPFPAVLFQPEEIRWRRLPDVNCRASGGSWVDGLMDGWFREFPKCLEEWRCWCWNLQEIPAITDDQLRLQDFFPTTAMVSCGESGWWKMFMFDKNSLLYYRWVVASRRPNSTAQHMVDASQRSRCFMSHI